MVTSEVMLKKDTKSAVLISTSVLLSAFLLMFVHNAVVNIGISEGLSTNVYFALKWVSWGATAAGIITGFGLGALAAQAIWAMVCSQFFRLSKVTLNGFKLVFL